MRTQEEIIEEYQRLIDDKDNFGWRREILSEYLTKDSLKTILKYRGLDETDKDVAELLNLTDEDTERVMRTSEEQQDDYVIAEIKEYMEFALYKALNHRGISANRSIEKMSEWLWLLNRAELSKSFEEAEYQNYGVPKLKVICDSLKIVDFSKLDVKLQNMAKNLQCETNCYEGCVIGD